MLGKLIEKWRKDAEELYFRSFKRECADDLEAALASPELREKIVAALNKYDSSLNWGEQDHPYSEGLADAILAALKGKEKI